MNSFLRVFYGRDSSRSLSYARFPFEELEKVTQILECNNCQVTRKIGWHELDGKYCCLKYIAGGIYGFALRRNNGEPMWNICLLVDNYHKNIQLEELAKVFETLKENGINLTLPKVEFEYIPPVSAEVSARYREEINGWYSAVDQIDIAEIQEIEAEWHQEHVNRSNGVMGGTSEL